MRHHAIAHTPPHLVSERMSGHRRGWRVGVTAGLVALLLAGMQLALGSGLAGQVALAAGLGGGPRTTYAPNTLARFRATGDAWGQTHAAHPKAANAPVAGPRAVTGKSAAQVGATSSSTALAQPITIALDPILLAAGDTPVGPALSYTSTDGLLGLDVSEYSLDVSQAVVASTGSTPVGPYSLVLTQTQGGFRAQAQQIGQFSLQAQDSQGRALAGVQLAAPLGLRFHVLPSELVGVNPDGISLVWGGTGSAARQVTAAAVVVSYDAATGWLAASSPTAVTLASTASATTGAVKTTATPTGGPARHMRGWVADPTPTGSTASASPLDPAAGPLVLAGPFSDANAASSEHLSMDGNQGDLGFGVPLDLPPAAGGLVPPLQLSYSSAGPNGRHSRQAPAGAVGDGWDLSLGSISYDSGTSMFYLNGVGGVSEPLLCCMTDAHGNTFYVPQHHPEIEVTTGNNALNPQTTLNWFRVRTPDGLEYDLGKTGGSLRSTVGSNGQLTYYEWDVSEVLRTVPNTTAGYLQAYSAQYWQDTATSNGVTYTRDAALKEIDYNYGPPTSSNPSPWVRLLFNVQWPDASQSAYGGLLTATQYAAPYACNGTPPVSSTLRCDDPVTPSGWEAAPLTMSTFTLDSLTVQVATAANAWQTARQYQFTYNTDTASYLCTSEITGQYYACAGEHILNAVQEVPYQGGTAEPSSQPIIFTYTPLENEYHDTTVTFGKPAEPYDAQTYWDYLTLVTNKQTGEQLTATYATGWGNTHGVPSGNGTDPTTCDHVSCTEPGDRQWPHQLVTSTTDVGDGSTTTDYAYQLNQPCGNGCTEDNWIPPNAWNACGNGGLPPNPPNPCLEGDWQNFYDADFMGFAQVTVTNPDGSASVTKYFAGNGWGSNDFVEPNTYDGKPFSEDTYQSGTSGTPLQEVQYSYLVDGYGDPICPVTSGSNQLYQNPYLLCFTEPASQTTYVGGGLSSSPAVPSETQTWTYNTSGNGDNHYYAQLTSSTTTGNDLTTDSVTAGGASYGATAPVFTSSTTYITHDDGNAPYYLVTTPAQINLTDNAPSGSTLWTCQQRLYDGQPYASGPQSTLIDGLVTEGDSYLDGNCANQANTNKVPSGAGYDVYGQPLVSTTPDGATGAPTYGIPSSHVACMPTTTPLVAAPASGPYSSCLTYDAQAHLYTTQTTNAGGQSTSATWDVVRGVASTATDLNQQTTTNSGPLYEYVPNQPVTLANFLDVYTSTVVPPDGSGKNPLWTSRTYSYSFCASSTTATVPCLETDAVREFDGINLLVTRQFYDRDGRLVETRTQGPTASLDTVQLTLYDDVNDKTFTSLPCQVTAYTSGRQPIVGFAYSAPTANGSGDDGAYVDPNSAGTACAAGTVFGTNTYSDALGRTVASDDPMGTGAGVSGSGCLLFGATLHHTSCAQYAAVVANSVPGLPSGDNAPYLQTINVDGNLHQTASYADALGRQAYGEQFTGWGQTPGSGITPYALTAYGYDALGHLVKSTDPGGNQTTYTYDALGRLTASSDPDRGVWHYTYDMDGNLIKSLGPRGAGADTFYAGYDGLDRQVWRNTSNSPTGAYVSYTYDDNTPCTTATNAIGRVCQQSFAGVSGSGLAGSYTDTYDQRGQVTQQVTTVNGSPYTTKLAYWPGGQIQNTTYPDGETVTPGYNAVGVVTGLTTKQNGVTTTLASNLTYGDNSGGAGATFGDGGRLVGMTLGGVYTTSYSYDDDTRLTDTQLTRTSDHTLFFESSRAYDGVGNVATLWSRVPQGTDTQAFCYDEQNRLTWAGSAGTPPSGCTSGTAPASTLPGGGYFQGYSYDNLDRLNLGDLGVYAYGSSGHAHAPTSITYGSAAYTATYDQAGNMVCRAPTNATTCAGPTPTGAQLQYDAEERLTHWQNAPSSPTTQIAYLYDGAGERVAQQVTSGGTTTTTAYLGGNEEVATTGGGTTTTAYYSVAGRLIALAVNGTFSYLAGDGLGSVSVAFDAHGNAQASALYRPYGSPRYTSGSMPGSFGFTGQRTDTALTGLDYDQARYYDPAAATFTTADNLLLDAKAVSAGQARMLLNRYAYVEGNPESRTDPSGHRLCDTKDGTCGQSHGDPCRGQPEQCAAIMQEFQDSRIRSYLLLLARTQIGSQFLTYILYMGNLFQNFITWSHLGGDGPGAISTDGGMIVLNSDGAVNDKIFYAAEIVHEAVESYFDVADGLRQMAAVHADYVAEWFAGEFMFQLDPLGTATERPRAYDLTYEGWLNSPDTTGIEFYHHLHGTNPPAENVDLNKVFLPGVAWGQDGVGLLLAPPDPMGLEPSMLVVDYIGPFPNLPANPNIM